MKARQLRVLNVISWFVCAFLAAPVIVVLIASVTTEEFVTFPPHGFTLRWYAEIGSHSEFMESLAVSLGVAAIVAPVSSVLGTLAALAVVRYQFMGKAAILGLLLSPLLIPSIVTAIALLQFLLAFGMGITMGGLIIGHNLITMPYTVRLVAASLVSANPNLERAAQNLGASPVKVFLYVTIPTIRPGLLGGALLAFLISFDDVTVSLFLSTPTLVTLPVRIFTYIDQAMSPMITAVSSVMIFISLGGVLLVERLFGLKRIFIPSEEKKTTLRAVGRT